MFSEINEGRADSAFLKKNKKFAIKYYGEALKDLTTALKLCQEINNKLLITEKYIFLGRVYRKLHLNSLSRIYLLKAIPLAKELRMKDLVQIHE